MPPSSRRPSLVSSRSNSFRMPGRSLSDSSASSSSHSASSSSASRGIREESWVDFHDRHHSKAYHYSCANEKMLRKSLRIHHHHHHHDLDQHDEDDDGWFSHLVDAWSSSRAPPTNAALTTRSHHAARHRTGQVDDSLDSRSCHASLGRTLAPGVRPPSRFPLSRRKSQGNIKLDSIEPVH